MRVDIYGQSLTVLWDLIGFEIIAAICNFKSKAQHDLLKKVKDHHIAADFMIICLQTLAKEICYQFCKEWSKHNSHIPTYQDLKNHFSLGIKVEFEECESSENIFPCRWSIVEHLSFKSWC